MTFTEYELRERRQKIMYLTIGFGPITEIVKGRLSAWDENSLTLTGDDQVADPLFPPDDMTPPEDVKVTRLGPGEQRRVPFLAISSSTM